MAILVTDFRICVEEAIVLFVGRWSIETTFQEISQHLGIKTIHIWSDTSINRTALTIIASYSLACLIVDQATKETGVEIRPETSAWYEKSTVTFSDVMVCLKLLILNARYFPQSTKEQSTEKITFEELFNLVAFA